MIRATALAAAIIATILWPSVMLPIIAAAMLLWICYCVAG